MTCAKLLGEPATSWNEGIAYRIISQQINDGMTR